MSYSYEAMNNLNYRHTKTELAMKLGTTRPTFDKWLIKYKKEKYCKDNLILFNKLRDAIQSEFGLSPENFIKQISSDLYICSIKRV